MNISSFDVLKSPVISEKSTLVKETENTVVLKVAKEATKVQIKRAVEEVFKVKVEAVRTVNVRGKNARRGRYTGQKSNWKKAYVKLGEGDTIEFFEGV